MIARVALSPRPVEPSPQPSPPRSKPRPIRPQPKRPFEFVCLINAVLKNPPIRHAREAEAMCDHVWIFEARVPSGSWAWSRTPQARRRRRALRIAVQPFNNAAGRCLGLGLRTRQSAIELNDASPLRSSGW
jgi:hypothetical protein